MSMFDDVVDVVGDDDNDEYKKNERGRYTINIIIDA